MDTVARLEAIPHPPGLWFVGNFFDVDRNYPIQSLMDLARKYGPIYELEALGRGPRIIVSSYDLVNELCDESRFEHMRDPVLKRTLGKGPAAPGLFFAETADPNWQKAHNLLLPAFGGDAMRSYFPHMLDIAVQLMQKWERLNPDDTVEVHGDMTRLTLDTIALCGFGFRFNSFYRDTPHPFVAALLDTLAITQAQRLELPLQNKLQPKRARRLLNNQQLMVQTVENIIQHRRNSGTLGTVNDLLDRMLTGVDRQSGEKLDDRNIIAQCLTFLIAGQDSPSRLLAFALYALLKNPDLLARAYEEVDRVLGTDPNVLPTTEQIHQLTYVVQVLEETLRLWPPAPGFSRHARENTVIGGKYLVDKNTPIFALSSILHRDKKVWGDDPERFDPDRFSPENRAKIPPNAYKPFGTGQRACIGRQFAMQQTTLGLAMLLQRFEFIDFDNYQLEVKQALTIRPNNFRIKVRTRPGRKATELQTGSRPIAILQTVTALALSAKKHQTPLLVLYGSNLGTAETLAHTIAEDATNRGFIATAKPLDEHVGSLPKKGAVVIVTASYNGQPPDNAIRFCQWLQGASLSPDAFAGVHYTVFGCGNRDWAATYQAIPTLIDTQLERHGAKSMYKRGAGDGSSDFDGDYRTWYGGLWSAMAAALQLPDSVAETKTTGARFSVTFINKEAANLNTLSYSAVGMTVRANRELQRQGGERPSKRSTRHLEITIPPGITYNAGDHLGIVPRNGLELIQRVLLRFKLNPGLYLTITPMANADTYLPVDEPLPLLDVLANRVELQDVATRAQLATLAKHTQDVTQRKELLALAGADTTSSVHYREHVLAPRKSILDLLDEFPSCALPFEMFLDLLPPLRPRYYSISSSPRVSADTCSITVGVLERQARNERGIFKGVSSNYLASQPVDATVYGFIRKPTIPFSPPENPHLPIIMVGPGTGIAPFRGFLQERAALQRQGVPIGESMLFFGCRDPLQDFFYEDELRALESAGVVRVFCAFSREPGKPKTFVQQMIKNHSGEVWRLLQQEAVVFVSGEASRMAPGVRRAFTEVFQEHTGAMIGDAQTWLYNLVANNRYLEDIWGSAI